MLNAIQWLKLFLCILHYLSVLCRNSDSTNVDQDGAATLSLCQGDIIHVEECLPPHTTSGSRVYNIFDSMINTIQIQFSEPLAADAPLPADLNSLSKRVCQVDRRASLGELKAVISHQIGVPANGFKVACVCE